MKKDREWVLCDGDDTLIGTYVNGQFMGTSDAYNHYTGKFFDALESLGFDRKEVFQEQLEVGRQLCEREGFSRKRRFPISFRYAYRNLATRRGERPSKKIEELVESIGWRVFELTPCPFPGAVEVLQELSLTYNLAIVTKGNRKHQLEKVIKSGCRALVDKVVVMKTKSVDEWESRVLKPLGISGDNRGSHWVLGDSIRSDINPALRLGLSAIHIPAPTWGFEDSEYESVAAGARLVVVEKIQDVLDHL